MDRRAWLRRAALLAAAGVAGTELELLDRLLSPRRLYVPGADFGGATRCGSLVDGRLVFGEGELRTALKRVYGKLFAADNYALWSTQTPFVAQLGKPDAYTIDFKTSWRVVA